MKSQEFTELKDMIEGIAIMARQSGVPSQVLLEIRNKLDNHIAIHEEDIKNINLKLDPVYKAFQTASGFKATIVLMATTIGSIWAIFEGWKKLIGK